VGSETVAAEPQVHRVRLVTFADLVESNTLALSQESEHGSVEAPGLEEDLGAIIVPHDHPDTGDIVVRLDDSLHQTFSTLPALMHDVQTRARRELLPCFTRIFWMFGRHVFEERLWEKLTCFPVHGSLPQISHRYAIG
jgi:hypothetical protein